MNETKELRAAEGCAPMTGSPVLVMPRWKMLDVVWLKHYWAPRGLVIGISRSASDPNKIRYDLVNEWEVTNSFSAAECVNATEWREEMERYLIDEYTPREWRAKMATVEAFEEPPCWEQFRQRWKETGNPYLPPAPPWRIDQTNPENASPHPIARHES